MQASTATEEKPQKGQSPNLISAIAKASPEALRGFAKGFLVYFVPFSILSRGVNRKVLARATAIGSFAATIRFLMKFLKAVDQKSLLDKTRRLAISGFTASLVASRFDSNLVESSFVCWIVVRAIRAISPDVNEYVPVFFMCLASAFLGGAWLRRPHQLHPGYLKFLDKNGLKDKQCLKAIRANPPVLGADMCKIAHPGMSCSANGFHYLILAFRNAFKLYAPLYLVFFIISIFSKDIKSLNKPALIQKSYKTLSDLLRSSSFLAVYTSIVWAGICVTFNRKMFPLVRNWGGKLPDVPMSLKNMRILSFITGFALLIERSSRRVELASYCMAFTLDHWYRMCLDNKVIAKPIGWLGVVILSVASAICVANPNLQPAIFSSWLLGINSKKDKSVERSTEKKATSVF